VLTIDRENLHALAPGRGHHRLAGHDENLLARHGEILPGLDRRERRSQAARADDGDKHEIGLGEGREFDQPASPSGPLDTASFACGNSRPASRNASALECADMPTISIRSGRSRATFPRTLPNRARGSEDDDAAFFHETPITNRR
jgi:hypothetical protein